MPIITIRKFILISILNVLCLHSANVFAAEIDHALKDGRQTFIKNCSICHGENAKGDGIFAELLNIPTADLTELSKYSEGRFPFKEIYLIIDGREHVKQHGPRHMPIWGERFTKNNWSHISEEHADTIIRGQIFELLLYLESIQE